MFDGLATNCEHPKGEGRTSLVDASPFGQCWCSLNLKFLLTGCLGGTILILTTDPFSMGTFCSRPVNITCTGSESTFTFNWKNGSVDIARYGFFSDQTFPYPLTLVTPLQGVTAEVTNATSFGSVINIVSTLFVEDVSVLNGYSIYCQDGSGVRSRELNINVEPQAIGPQITTNVTVMAVYTYCKLQNSAELTEVRVQWEELGQPVIFDGCSFNEKLKYTVLLEDNGAIIEQKLISSDSCVNGVCATSFAFTSSRSYRVSIRATNIVGSDAAQSLTIDGSVQFFAYSLSLNGGAVVALCIPLVESAVDNSSNCSIQYTKDSSFNNLSPPVIGPFNIPFVIPIKERVYIYYHQATVVINSSLVISVRSRSFINGSAIKRSGANITLKLYQISLVCLLFTILSLALIISIGNIIYLKYKLKNYSHSLTTVSKISRAAEPSNYQEIQLAPTLATADITQDIKQDALASVKYDEIEKDHAVTSKSEILLKANYAYQSS